MNEHPLVSLILPIYNGSKYIKNILDDIKGQTYNNIEIILVNDGSTDDTKEIISSYITIYDDLNIKLYNISNSGVSKARNIGLSYCSGKYVCFIDCDDRISKLYVETLLKSLISNSSHLVISGYSKVLCNKSIYDFIKTSGEMTKVEFITNILSYNSISCSLWNKMFCIDLIKENNIKFNEDIYIGEDLLFLIEYVNFTDSIYYVNEILYYYTINNQGAMKSINNGINEKHISEWHSICMVSNMLGNDYTTIPTLFKKKVLIAHKLLSLLKLENKFKDKKIEVSNYLIHNIKPIILSDQFKFKTKISILLNTYL